MNSEASLKEGSGKLVGTLSLAVDDLFASMGLALVLCPILDWGPVWATLPFWFNIMDTGGLLLLGKVDESSLFRPALLFRLFGGRLSITISRGSLSCGTSDHLRGRGGMLGWLLGRLSRSFSREGGCLLAGPSSLDDGRLWPWSSAASLVVVGEARGGARNCFSSSEGGSCCFGRSLRRPTRVTLSLEEDDC